MKIGKIVANQQADRADFWWSVKLTSNVTFFVNRDYCVTLPLGLR